jgi:hypothetical protein
MATNRMRNEQTQSPATSVSKSGPRGLRELAMFGIVDLLYDAGRWVAAGRLPVARAHADWVTHLERSLHVADEGGIRHALDEGVASMLLANIYLAAQLVVLPGALIWIYRRAGGVYRQLRNTVVISWLIAVPVFAAFPVAPPRLAQVGIDDTVSKQTAFSLTGHSTIFYNPYAAVPSLHVGFAFTIGVALAATVRTRWIRPLALCWGPLVTLAVIATGNHYFFDAVAGLIVSGLAFAAGRAVDRLIHRRTPSGARGRFDPVVVTSQP